MQETTRCCRYCPTKDCTWREFSDPSAKCPEHGKGETEENRPYLGRPVAQHPTFKGSKA